MDVVEIRVGIAEYTAAYTPSKIITIGLGSCVGIALYDSINRIGGLSHIMLPESKDFLNITTPGKFPDLAVPILLSKMESMGANKRNIVAKIGGGASMFNFTDKSLVMDIGRRNVTSVKNILLKLSIMLRGEDVGGNQGRTMILDVETGKTFIRTVSRGTVEI